MANHDMSIASTGSTPSHVQQALVRDSVRGRLLAALPVTERSLSLNGLRTAVLEGGEGVPIVLLHGPGGYAAHWSSVIPDLTLTHRVVAPDLPGHGASDPVAGLPDHDMTLGWLDDLIECTCHVPPVLVGQTLGGALAARFAAERGVRLRALVLVDTLGLTAFQPVPEFASALEAFLSTPTSQTHDRLWSQCAFDLPALRSQLGEQWEWLKAYNLDRVQAPGRLATLSSLMAQFGVPAIPPPMLARITVPTALIWGRQDRATSLQIASDASARYGWELRVIDAAADDPALEQPQAFVNVLRELVAHLGTQGGAS